MTICLATVVVRVHANTLPNAYREATFVCQGIGRKPEVDLEGSVDQHRNRLPPVVSFPVVGARWFLIRFGRSRVQFKSSCGCTYLAVLRCCVNCRLCPLFLRAPRYHRFLSLRCVRFLLRRHSLILVNSIGSTLEERLLPAGIVPLKMAMSGAHVVVSGAAAAYVWQYKNQASCYSTRNGALNWVSTNALKVVLGQCCGRTRQNVKL